MIVVNTDMTENPSNLSAVNAKVAAKANTDIRHPFLSAISIFTSKPVSLSGFSAISEKAITPSVANALNHSDKSKTAVGLNRTIRNTEMNRDVTASALLDKRKMAPDMISIKPDLSTDAEKPVNAI